MAKPGKSPKQGINRKLRDALLDFTLASLGKGLEETPQIQETRDNMRGDVASGAANGSYLRMIASCLAGGSFGGDEDNEMTAGINRARGVALGELLDTIHLLFQDGVSPAQVETAKKILRDGPETFAEVVKFVEGEVQSRREELEECKSGASSEQMAAMRRAIKEDPDMRREYQQHLKGVRAERADELKHDGYEQAEIDRIVSTYDPVLNPIDQRWQATHEVRKVECTLKLIQYIQQQYEDVVIGRGLSEGRARG